MKKSRKIAILLFAIIIILGVANKVEANSTAEVNLISNDKLAPGKNVKVTLVLSSFIDDDKEDDDNVYLYDEDEVDENDNNHIIKEKLIKKEILIDSINYDTDVFEEITIDSFTNATNWKIFNTEWVDYIVQNDTGNYRTGTVVTLNLKVKDDFAGSSSSITFENIKTRNHYQVRNASRATKVGMAVALGNRTVTLPQETVVSSGEKPEESSSASSTSSTPTNTVTEENEENVENKTNDKVGNKITGTSENKTINPSTSKTNLPYTGEISTTLSLIIAVVILVTSYLLLKNIKLNKDKDDEIK